jgi:hypothetical protein
MFKNTTFVCLALLSLTFVSTAVGLASDSVCKTNISSLREVPGPGSCAGDIFLKGQYVEVGIHNAASFGTNLNAPTTSTYGSQRLGK